MSRMLCWACCCGGGTLRYCFVRLIVGTFLDTFTITECTSRCDCSDDCLIKHSTLSGAPNILVNKGTNSMYRAYPFKYCDIRYGRIVTHVLQKPMQSIQVSTGLGLKDPSLVFNTILHYNKMLTSNDSLLTLVMIHLTSMHVGQKSVFASTIHDNCLRKITNASFVTKANMLHFAEIIIRN